MQELREKLAAKRAVQSKEDDKANRANDALRRKAGQVSLAPQFPTCVSPRIPHISRADAEQDQAKIKEDMEAKEITKEADRKRREKIEDQKARAAIKAQIEVSSPTSPFQWSIAIDADQIGG